jgi:hypothetical protein
VIPANPPHDLTHTYPGIYPEVGTLVQRWGTWVQAGSHRGVVSGSQLRRDSGGPGKLDFWDCGILLFPEAVAESSIGGQAANDS